MSEAVQLALIATITPTLIATATLIIGIRNSRKIETIHKATNSMKDALVEVTRTDALQEGHTQGVKDEQKRTAKGPRRKIQ